MSFILLLLAAVSFEFGPARPTVGDPVSVRYAISSAQRVEIEPADDYELVREGRDSVVIRAFRPGTFVLRGSVVEGEGASAKRQAFSGPKIEVVSTLAAGDDLRPAPLVPPVPLPPPQHLRTAMVSAAGVAAASWIALLLLSSRVKRKPIEAAPAAVTESFAAAIARLEQQPFSDVVVIQTAEALRTLLGSADPAIDRTLTTTELLRRAVADLPSAPVDRVRRILHAGDLAKFSRRGSGAERSLFFEDAHAVASALEHVPA